MGKKFELLIVLKSENDEVLCVLLSAGSDGARGIKMGLEANSSQDEEEGDDQNGGELGFVAWIARLSQGGLSSGVRVARFLK